MKKAYVTPVMESEAFVANEYVAACYRIRCTDGEEGYVDLADDPSFDWLDDDEDGFGTTLSGSFGGDGPRQYYTGVINGKDPHETYRYWLLDGLKTLTYHEIESWEKVTSSDPHPNASV